VCHDPTSRPPPPPIAGGAGSPSGSGATLVAADGNRLLAHVALAADPGGPAVVVLPDVRGLHPFYADLAERFAAAGIHATAIDYFGRSAGTASRDAATFAHQEHVRLTTPDTVALDVAAAVAHVRSPAGGAATRVFTVGFCFGGRNSFNQAGRGHGLDGVVGFYGFPQPSSPDDANAPVVLSPTYACPVLGFFGDADASIPAEEAERFRRALDEAGVPGRILVYPGAPHSFFDRRAEAFREESDDAWRRILAFVERPQGLGDPDDA
jgi:carboxymethylenebutenolidase